MKLTASQLKQIIKEEKEKLLREGQEFYAHEVEGPAFRLEDGGKFTLSLKISGRSGAETIAIVEGRLFGSSLNSLNMLTGPLS